MGSGSRKIGKMRSLAIVLLSAVALSRANPCQNDQDVYFPDREDCGRFYMCRNGEVVGHMNCPDGLLWNTDLLTCDWPRNVECTPGCPEGWSSVGDSCYFLSRERIGKFSAAPATWTPTTGPGRPPTPSAPTTITTTESSVRCKQTTKFCRLCLLFQNIE